MDCGRQKCTNLVHLVERPHAQKGVDMVAGLCRITPMETENKMLKEKCAYLWDYYKDCFGVRPRHFELGFWQDEVQVDAAIADCDAYLDSMKRTSIGREKLREDGWIVEEM